MDIIGLIILAVQHHVARQMSPVSVDELQHIECKHSTAVPERTSTQRMFVYGEDCHYLNVPSYQQMQVSHNWFLIWKKQTNKRKLLELDPD